MPSCLIEVQGTVQQVAEAIAAVLDLDVEIADDRLCRIAGTGKFAECIGEYLKPDGFVNRKALHSGDYVLIEHPGKDALCSRCTRTKNCYATALLCYPIKLGNTTIGTISLVTQGLERRGWLLENTKACLRFLGKMAELVTSKVLEEQAMLAQRCLQQQLETVSECLGEGLIVVDRYGKITHFNAYSCKFFEIQSEAVIGKDLCDVIEESGLYDVLCDGKDRRHQRALVRIGAKTCRVIYDAFLIAVEGKPAGAVFKFRDAIEASRMAYEIAHAPEFVSFEDIIGVSEPMVRVKDQARQVAKSWSTILVLGESGTGKELFARAIHSGGDRARRPFVPVNCGAIPDTLLESELFGYEDGAFTGARKGGKAGKFELAHGGTLFLDEIGDMPLHLQSKLLRVLEDKKVEPLGSTSRKSLDIRLICATHRDLETMVDRGEFRSDLFHRLNVVPLTVPPLRDRREDIPSLANHFMKRYSAKLGKSIKNISQDALSLMLSYDWPGNVRELANCIEYAVNMEKGDTISAEVLRQKVTEVYETKPTRTSDLCLANIEIKKMIEALERYGTSTEGKKRAAAALGISVATLYRRLKNIPEKEDYSAKIDIL